MARRSDFGHEHMMPNSTSLVHVDDTVTCSVHNSPGTNFGSCIRSTKSSPVNAGTYFNQGCQTVRGNSTRCATCFCHMSGQVKFSDVGYMVGVLDGTTLKDGSGVGAKDTVGSGVQVGAGIGTDVGPSLPMSHDGHGVGMMVGFGVIVGCGVTVGWTVGAHAPCPILMSENVTLAPDCGEWQRLRRPSHDGVPVRVSTTVMRASVAKGGMRTVRTSPALASAP